VKINCLSCGFAVNLDDDSYSDYDGQVKCLVCKTVLELKVTDGSVNRVMILDPTRSRPTVKRTRSPATVAATP